MRPGRGSFSWRRETCIVISSDEGRGGQLLAKDASHGLAVGSPRNGIDLDDRVRELIALDPLRQGRENVGENELYAAGVRYDGNFAREPSGIGNTHHAHFDLRVGFPQLFL